MAKVISLEEVCTTPLGNVVWLEVGYSDIKRTGMEPFLIDIDDSQYVVLVNARDHFDNVCEEQLKQDILQSCQQGPNPRFRFWDGKASTELKQNTPWIKGEYYEYG